MQKPEARRPTLTRPLKPRPAPEPSPVLRLFASCPRGLEALLAREIQDLGAGGARISPGGVAFEGDATMVWRVNLHSRLASRVLREVGTGPYRDEHELYHLTRRLPWERLMRTRQTLRVDTTAVRSPLRSLNFANLRVKDGIVDRLRETEGDRPSIDTRHPDIRVHVFLQEQQATVYLDTSGESLFKRGWRREREDKGLAPLKENLAAGLLMLAGWTPEQTLLDPYCGSGTLLIEAAQIAMGIAPGLSRAFAFEKLRDHDAQAWAALRGEAIRQAQQRSRDAAGTLRILGSDIDPAAIAQATRNLSRAGVSEVGIRLQVVDAGEIAPPDEHPGVIVTNPPYGERLDALPGNDDERFGEVREIGAVSASRMAGRSSASGPEGSGDAGSPSRPADAAAARDDAEHQAAMAAFGRALKQRFAGWQAHVLTSDRELPRQLGIRGSRKTPLFNGALECRLYRFEVFDRRTREEHDRLHAERHARLRAAGGGSAQG